MPNVEEPMPEPDESAEESAGILAILKAGQARIVPGSRALTALFRDYAALIRDDTRATGHWTRSADGEAGLLARRRRARALETLLTELRAAYAETEAAVTGWLAAHEGTPGGAEAVEALDHYRSRGMWPLPGVPPLPEPIAQAMAHDLSSHAGDIAGETAGDSLPRRPDLPS
jgi:hypothetical protein